jgi:hypothetical protein
VGRVSDQYKNLRTRDVSLLSFAAIMLADLPVEVLLYYILPVLALQDILRLGSTSRFFAELTNDGRHACWEPVCCLI